MPACSYTINQVLVPLLDPVTFESLTEWITTYQEVSKT